MASIYNNMGKWLQLDGKLVKAEETYRKGMGFSIRVELEAPECRRRENRWHLGQAVLGELLRATKRNEDSEALFKQAIDRLEQLAAEYPSVPRYKKHLATRTRRAEHAVLVDGPVPGIDRGKTKRPRCSIPACRSNEQIHLNNLAWYLVTVPDLATRNDGEGPESGRASCKALPPDVAKLEYAGRGSIPQS